MPKGQSPLAFLLEVMRDESQDIDLRLAAAIGAAPYVHHQLYSISGCIDLKVTEATVLPRSSLVTGLVESSNRHG